MDDSRNSVEATPENLIEFNIIGRDQEEINALGNAMTAMSNAVTPLIRLDSARIRVDRILFGDVARLMQITPTVLELGNGYKEYRMLFRHNNSEFTLWTT